MRLKFNDFDSSFAARKQYFSSLGGSGTYTGSSSQNTWLIQKMKQSGYKRGGALSDLIKKTGEDGVFFGRTGEEVLTEKKVNTIDMASTKMQKLMDSIPSHNNLNKISSLNSSSRNLELHLDSIVMHGVNNPAEFAINLTNALKHDTKVQKLLQANTIDLALGKNSLSKHRF